MIQQADNAQPSFDDLTKSSAELWAQWPIDPYRNPYDVPLDELAPAHPDIFEAGTELPIFDRLRSEDPLHFVADSPFGPHWNVTKFKDVMEIERRHDVFSSDIKYGGIQLGGVRFDDNPDPTFTLPMFIMMDPPKHDEQRAVVQPLFTQRNLVELEALIRERVIDILEALPRNEEFDWVEQVSKELTGQMLATLFDIPQEDRHLLIHWSDTVNNVANQEFFESVEVAFAELWKCYEYFAAVWEERKKSGARGNDLISMLVNNEATNNMPPNEYLGNILLLIVGGNDTTRNSISGGLLALHENPDQYAKLRNDPGVIPNMVSEMIRYQSPVAHMARTAMRDIEFGGKSLKEGDRLALWYVSANRDEAEIENANSFVVDRARARHHLAFGFGIHRCVGNRLGEMQLRLLWEEIHKRFDRIEVVGEPKRLRSHFIRGIRELPVRIPA